MKRIKLPSENRDLRRLVLRRKLIKLAVYAAWCGALTVGFLSFRAGHERHPLAPWQTALWLGGGAIVGFFALRIYRFWTDRSFRGIVFRSGISHDVKGEEFRLNTVIRATDPQTGKRRRFRFEQKSGFYLRYREGVRICKFPFLTYPLPDPNTVAPEGLDGAFCVVCGHIGKAENGTCAVCGHSLVDPEQVFSQ